MYIPLYPPARKEPHKLFLSSTHQVFTRIRDCVARCEDHSHTQLVTSTFNVLTNAFDVWKEDELHIVLVELSVKGLGRAYAKFG